MGWSEVDGVTVDRRLIGRSSAVDLFPARARSPSTTRDDQKINSLPLLLPRLPSLAPPPAQLSSASLRSACHLLQTPPLPPQLAISHTHHRANGPMSPHATSEPHARDGHYRITYEDIHLAIGATAKRIKAEFNPDIMVAIGGGGFFPARVLVRLSLETVSREI